MKSLQLGSFGPRGGFRAASAAGELIYAIGDIHGRYDLLVELLAAIAQDGEPALREKPPVLVFLGDYIDRGPDSAKVVEALTWLERRRDYSLRFLKGNHEKTLLDFLEDPAVAVDWLRFGGIETLQSYGVEAPTPEGPLPAFVEARDALLRNMPAAHLRFYERLETFLEIGDYVFVHAGIRAGRTIMEQSEEDMLWIRDEFIGSPGPFERVVVHGHTWFDERPRLLQHRIGVDTGAYRTGVLTAVRIEDDDLTVLQVRAPESAGATEADLLPLESS
jgi:serine/threonine protein phosphatase 1